MSFKDEMKSKGSYEKKVQTVRVRGLAPPVVRWRIVRETEMKSKTGRWRENYRNRDVSIEAKQGTFLSRLDTSKRDE